MKDNNDTDIMAKLNGNVLNDCKIYENNINELQINEYGSDLRSNGYYLSSNENKACTGFEPMTSALTVQRPTN